jgi:two-component system, chemotaxis family, response regulator Rcp1
MPETKRMDILLVEDNPADIRLTREALMEWKRPSRLHVAKDGEEALEFLRREGRFSAAPRPDIVIIDLNLPRKDGRELLAEMKQDDSLKCLPVVVLTTSRAEQDISRTYEMHANCYVIKPSGLEEFMAAIRSIDTFWSEVVTLPPQRREGAGEG